MGPTTKTARARQSPSDDPHTTRILLEIDLAVGVCGISEASANLPGPAGAKAMSVSNFPGQPFWFGTQTVATNKCLQK